MRNYESVLKAIVAWPPLVYEEEAFPDVVAFCKFHLEQDDNSADEIMTKLHDLIHDCDEAEADGSINVKRRDFEKRYRTLMRHVKKYGGVQ